jgi:hypothetical protein
MQADTIQLFDSLARRMNTRPEQFEPLGDIDLDLVCVMRRESDTFSVRLRFEGIGCTGVGLCEAGDEHTADCWLEGSLDAWSTMFDDVCAHGGATGMQTLNSLTLLGDRIALHGDDPMGVDRFHRFNQSVQEFFDGAAALDAAPTVN